MKVPEPVTIDFETFGIEGRPAYPPEPVGVSIKYPGKEAKYYAFGHPTENNSCWDEVEAVLYEALNFTDDGVLFHNAKFDIEVLERFFPVFRIDSWDVVHDTMFLIFLADPHQNNLGLKETADRLLDIKPEEQDAVKEWLLEHQPIDGVKISASRNSPHYFGRYIAYAPGDIVGKYANGDTERTEALFKLLWPRIQEAKMGEAYDRERRLMPILLEMEQQGLPIDVDKLEGDVTHYQSWEGQINTWLHTKLDDPTVNLDSGEQLINALLIQGLVNEEALPKTPTGKFQSNQKALLKAVSDPVIVSMLTYRAQLKTCLNTFMRPWLETAKKSKGYIYTTWNQVRSPKGSYSIGTRTGRLSSNPNLQNIPNKFNNLWAHQEKGLPLCPLENLPSLPNVRSYIIPFSDHLFIDRDYSQQEPRILAHFAGGEILEAYKQDPRIDFHDHAKKELERLGKFYNRKPVKNTNLGIIYGMGIGKLAESNKMSLEEARSLKKAILQLYPGIKDMYQEMRRRASCEEPIRTWGGRQYFCEEPKLVDGKLRQFDYKMVNVLIQGSAADCTKEALIRFHERKKVTWHIVLNVHDQITVSVPIEDAEEAMEVLRETMESIELDVPLLSEGSISTTNWSELKGVDESGVISSIS